MIKEVMICIKLGCDLSGKGDYEDKISGASALHVAALYGQDKIFELLLETKTWIDANALDAEGQTPLHFACFGGQISMIKMLIH